MTLEPSEPSWVRAPVHGYRLLLATIVATMALVSLTAAATGTARGGHIPTTADFADTGPEDPAGGQYGVQHPSSFEIGVVPVSYDFAAHGVRWKSWGSPVAVGRGTARFCVIMSPCHSGVNFVMVLFDRRLVSCEGDLTHYSYTRFRMHMPARYQPHPFTEEVHVGCVTR
jgi:hypothetical protein